MLAGQIIIERDQRRLALVSASTMALAVPPSSALRTRSVPSGSSSSQPHDDSAASDATTSTSRVGCSTADSRTSDAHRYSDHVDTPTTAAYERALCPLRRHPNTIRSCSDRLRARAISRAYPSLPAYGPTRSAERVPAQGLGKTMIPQNAAHQAILMGHSVLFITAADLLFDPGSWESSVLARTRPPPEAQTELVPQEESRLGT
jgi:hypothetical protein